jgi:hypothetical protein
MGDMSNRTRRGIIARGNGTWSAVTTRRVVADAETVPADGPRGSVRAALSASASRFHDAIAYVTDAATADAIIGHAADACHAPYIASGRAVTRNRRARVYDADVMAAIGFVADAATDAYRVFGIGAPSAPDASADPGAYVTPDGTVTADADACRTAWRERAAARRA